MSLHLSKCHIVGNHVSWLNCEFWVKRPEIYSPCCIFYSFPGIMETDRIVTRQLDLMTFRHSAQNLFQTVVMIGSVILLCSDYALLLITQKFGVEDL